MNDTTAVVPLLYAQRSLAVMVDNWMAERDALVKELGVPPLQGSPTAGGILLEGGMVAVVLNPVAMVECFQQEGKAALFQTTWKGQAPASQECSSRTEWR